MYAVVRSGGKQARVAPGDSLRIERIQGVVGDTVELNEVLLVGPDAPRSAGDAHAARAEDRLAVGSAERLHERDLLGQRAVDRVQRKFRVHDAHRGLARLYLDPDRLHERRAKLVDAIGVDGESGCRRVPAVAHEQIRAGSQRFVQAHDTV